jgi:hypothetical protein
MGKMLIVPAFFVLGLLTSLLVGVQTAGAQYAQDGRYFPLASPINITSPSNNTYSSSLLTLNITFKLVSNLDRTNITMFYSVDGKDNVTIRVSGTFVPIEVTRTYENGTTENGISIFSYYVITGCVALPELPEGSHEITVYGEYKHVGGSNFNVFDSSTVYFTTDDGNPPVLSNLSLENKTYSQNNLSLNFATDEPTSWIGYCLDGKTNVTITENTTLTDIATGSHSLTVFANDTVGNMGASETINFTVDQRIEPSPATIAAASTVSVVVVSAGLLVYFKKKEWFRKS